MRNITSTLPPDSRKRSLEILKPLIAGALDLKLQTKLAHWNLRGPRFFQLHELFDHIAGELDEPIDEIAERIGQLGELVTATVQTLAGQTMLPPISVKECAEEYFIQAIRTALVTLGEELRRGVDATAEANDPATSDLLTSVLRTVDKQLWFLDSHLQS